MNREFTKRWGRELRAVGPYVVVLALVLVWRIHGLHGVAWYSRAAQGVWLACGPFAWVLTRVPMSLVLLVFITLWTGWLLIVLTTALRNARLGTHIALALTWFAAALPVLAITKLLAAADHEFETRRVVARLQKGDRKPEQDRVCIRVNKCFCWIGCEWAEYVVGQSTMDNSSFRIVTGSESGSVGTVHYYVPPGYVTYPFEWLSVDTAACPSSCKLEYPATPGVPGSGTITEPPFSCHASGNRCERGERGE